MSMRKVLCPSCRQFLEHDRGYLPTHMTDLVRGNLTTGSRVCDASNKKIITDLLTVEYKHTCRECGVETEIKLTEDYPGAMEQREPFIEMDCFGCTVSHDGYYCANEGCGLEVKWHDDEWHITEPGAADTKVVYSETEADAHVAAWHAANGIAGAAVSPLPSSPTPQLWGGAAVMPVAAQVTTAQQAKQLLPGLTVPVGPLDEPTVLHLEAGWYEVNPRPGREFIARRACGSDDPTGNGLHQGVFKAEFHRKVLVSDGHIIQEEPDGSRETQEV